MDETGVKLLILVKKDKFDGLITIGDIQRAIIKNLPLDTIVDSIKRNSIHVASTNDDLENIKQWMLAERDECMPIIDQEGNIADVIFWEDLFTKDNNRNKSKIDTPVIIMAGGLGTRMRPLTNVIPKPLIPLGDLTIAEEIIKRFCNLGATTFMMSVNYKAEMIRLHFKDKVNGAYQLDFFEENQPLGTGGSLHLLNGKINSTFFVTNCDVIIEQDYRDILEFHRSNKNEITMVCSLKSVYIPYGTLTTGDEGQLLEMQEKPEITFKINSGMYILEPHLLREIPDDRIFHITELIELVRKRSGRVGVFPISEKQYFDIGEWDKYQDTLLKYKQQID